VLAVVYLHHTNAQQPWDRVAQLILTGAFDALAGHTASPDPILRSQALATLIAMTAHPGYDWFAPAVGSRDRAMHRALLSLAPPRSRFVHNLVFENFNSVFPGSSLLALQLLAFWLSWARRLYTKDGVLRLSGTVLARLEAWAGAAAGTGDGHAAVGGDTGMEGGGEGNLGVNEDSLVTRSAEELDLAKRLVDDFGRFGPASDSTADDKGMSLGPTGKGSSSQITGLQIPPTESSVETRDGPGITAVEPAVRSALEAAEASKDDANAAYAKGFNRMAERGYSVAVASLAQCRTG